MKLLFLVSSLDLTQPFSATPAWWQLLKGLVRDRRRSIATPYQGPAIESLWWRAAPNPAKCQGDAFQAAARSATRNLTRIKRSALHTVANRTTNRSRIAWCAAPPKR